MKETSKSNKATKIALIVVLLLLAYVVLSKNGKENNIENTVPTTGSGTEVQNPPVEDTDTENDGVSDAVSDTDADMDTVEKPASPSDAASMDESDGLE